MTTIWMNHDVLQISTAHHTQLKEVRHGMFFKGRVLIIILLGVFVGTSMKEEWSCSQKLLWKVAC